MANEYIPFLSKIKEIVKHTETEYTFRMTYVGDVRQGSFLKFLFRNMVRRLFLSVVSEKIMLI